jgi:hypothetical protein
MGGFNFSALNSMGYRAALSIKETQIYMQKPKQWCILLLVLSLVLTDETGVQIRQSTQRLKTSVTRLHVHVA